jgi:hypothetical protein
MRIRRFNENIDNNYFWQISDEEFAKDYNNVCNFPISNFENLLKNIKSGLSVWGGTYYRVIEFNKPISKFEEIFKTYSVELQINSLDDDYYLVDSSVRSGSKIKASAYKFKCDQVDGLVHFMEYVDKTFLKGNLLEIWEKTLAIL